jgi:transglutaminase-like putative cysteine protease
MHRFKILHRTYYNFSAPVSLEPHALRLRPREGHQLRIESSTLSTIPPSTVRWHSDVEDNSVAIATFADAAGQLMIESEVIIQQYNEEPLDFLVSEYATEYPLVYVPNDAIVLSPYMIASLQNNEKLLNNEVKKLWQPGENIQTYSLLHRINSHVHNALTYKIREEPGVQSAAETLMLGTGSCRDYAALFIEFARRLGFASRFVSGYLHTQPAASDLGATHAWAEVFLPGAGWKGFDPTIGEIAGIKHIAVAVSRLPELVPPVAGSYVGPAGIAATLDVGVWVTAL